MSSIPKALRQAQILAIPLTQPRITGKIQDKGRQALTYYQFQFERSPSPEEDDPKAASGWLPKGGLAKWASTKAATTWAGFGKAEGGWKLKLFQAGERMVDRMDFEELALKSLDPSMGPSLSNPRGNSLSKKLGEIPDEGPRVPLLFPSSIQSSEDTLNELRALLQHRIPRHRRGFWMWAAVVPFTVPFKLIPVIPNIPFFFSVWRSWSHYKAYKASEYLESLLEQGIIVPEASEELDSVYKDLKAQREMKPDETHEPTSIGGQTASARHTILLTRDAVPSVTELFGLDKDSVANVLRAVEQARVRVSTGRVGL